MARLIRHSKLSKKSLLLSAIPVVVMMAGCGGGGEDSTTESPPTASTQTVAVTGTVPGTIIQAYCSDGSNPSVNSELNGTDQHPFTLNVPAGRALKTLKPKIRPSKINVNFKRELCTR